MKYFLFIPQRGNFQKLLKRVYFKSVSLCRERKQKVDSDVGSLGQSLQTLAVNLQHIKRIRFMEFEWRKKILKKHRDPVITLITHVF